MFTKRVFVGCLIRAIAPFWLAGCTGGSGNGGTSAADAEIDYSLVQSWDAMPGIQSPAVSTPVGSGLSSLEATAKVDVFYIHPTTYSGHDFVNAPIDEPTALQTTAWIIQVQATPFNAIGRVFAPRYRQIASYVYGGSEDDMQAPLNLAFEDVRRAFRYYIDNLNQGRPFIIAGQSQGANHAHRLLLEEVVGKPCEDLFVAAWIPGMPIPRSSLGPPAGLTPCTTPQQIGCIAIWQTFGEGFNQYAEWLHGQVYWDPGSKRWVRPPPNELYFSVNPLTWNEGTAIAPASMNLGAVPFGIPETNFQGICPSLVSARNQQGYLFVSPADLPADLFMIGAMGDPRNYHAHDFNLFWMNIRENARDRVHAFLLGRQHVLYPLIKSSNIADGAVGRNFSYQITTVNAAQSYEAQGLPEGLNLNTLTGLISGAPLQRGTFAVVLKAANASGADVAELSIVVSSP